MSDDVWDDNVSLSTLLAHEAHGKPAKRTWPPDLPARIQALTTLLRTLEQPASTRELTTLFKGAKLDDLELTLRCAAAADGVVMLRSDAGTVLWATRE